MGFLDNLKSFVHSITTDDHYATYDSPYKNAVINGSSNNVGGNNSSSRLNELNRLATVNSSSQSLIRNSNNNSSTNVGYRPGLRSSQVNSTAELPMQTLNTQGQSPLPSIDSLWDRIEAWLDEEFPELEDNLNTGVTTADLNEFESDLGCGQLPTEFRQFYKRHDGQLSGGKPTGLIMGLVLMDLEAIVEEHNVWKKVSERVEKQQMALEYSRQRPTEGNSSDVNATSNNSFLSNQRSLPPNSVQSTYSHRGWIPIVKDDCGNQIAIDLAPGPNGIWGQVIIFGRDYDTKLVVAQSFQEFIFIFVNDLENGNFRIDDNSGKDGFLDNSRDDFDYVYGKEDADAGELHFLDLDKKEFGNSIDGKDLSYLDIFKLRALKMYGLAENFSTSYVPPHIKRVQERNVSSLPPQEDTSADISLLNNEKSGKVSFPKETLIDNDEIIQTPAKVEEELKESQVEVNEDASPAVPDASSEHNKEEQKEIIGEMIAQQENVQEESVQEETQTKSVDTKSVTKEDHEEPAKPEIDTPEKESGKENKIKEVVDDISDGMKEVDL